MANNRNIDFFNLKQSGDSAIIRLLHTSPSTIEHVMIHSVTTSDGKKRSVRCCGEHCPLCRTAPSERIYVHLIDYTDGKEKVWNRTPTILKQLDELCQNWGDLSKLIIKITRNGNEFPKYDIMLMPPQNLGVIPPDMIDEKIAYRFYLYRSAEEIQQFLQTGVMPAHVKQSNNSTYVPKEQYFQQQQNNFQPPNYQQTNYQSYPPQTTTPVFSSTPVNQQFTGYQPPYQAPSTPTPNTQVYVNGVPDESMFLDPFAPVQK